MAIIKRDEFEYHMDENLIANLKGLNDNLRKDYDAFVVVTGKERTGKSTLTVQMAKYVDPTFNIDRIVFTPEQFVKAVYNSQQYQAIVYDEAHGGLNAKGTMSTVNKRLIQTFTEMGFRNLFVFLVLPSFFELGRYTALHRSNLLIHTHERGAYMVFSHKRKKNIYIQGKKTLSIKSASNFKGRYSSCFPLDFEAYKEKKRISTTDLSLTEETREDKLSKLWKGRLENAIKVLHGLGYSQDQIANSLNINTRVIHTFLRGRIPIMAEEKQHNKGIDTLKVITQDKESPDISGLYEEGEQINAL